MYKICIPIQNKKYSESEKASLLRELKRMKTDIVFLIFERVLCNDDLLNELAEKFAENMKFLRDNGFRVGAWLVPTIGYGSEHWADFSEENEFVHIHSVDGDIAKGGYCPLYENFAEEFKKNVTTVAKLGVKEILFEDDFTLSGGKAILLGCCCDKHMQKYRKMVGEEISAEELREKMLIGGKNKYRDAWSALMGKTLCDFAKEIEKVIHAVDKEIRIVLSANASSYTLEGVSIHELARIIAGETKPMIRMTGAPYWTNAMTLGPNIDAVRVQEYWCGKDIELLTEGDTYPRPRSWVPSAYLECYDMILRAEGKSDGILKYVIDYIFNVDYETGYVDNHCRNEECYEKIEKLFADKEPVGLNVFEKENLFTDEEFETGIDSLRKYNRKSAVPCVSQWFLSDNSIPTTYGAQNCASIVFGANAHYVDDAVLDGGVILDAQAAKILCDKGVDVGIRSYQKAITPMFEYYVEENEYANVLLSEEAEFYEFCIDEKANVHSEFIIKEATGGFANISPLDKSGKRVPACYWYQNEKGQKFMVYSFVAQYAWVKSEWTPGIFRNYYRQKQLANGVEWLQERPLPAMCYKCPQAYILCKKDENSMTVGIWNLFADTIHTPQIVLDGVYRSAEFYWCDGILNRNKVNLKTDIIPYGFAVITLYK